MEARLKGKGHDFFGLAVSDSENAGKKSLDWDLNEWRWDGDLFAATRFNSDQSDRRSKQLFPVAPNNGSTPHLSDCASHAAEDVIPQNERGKGEMDKRRRIPVVEEQDLCDEGGYFNLNLGGQSHPDADADGKGGKKVKYSGNVSGCPGCQVQGCDADLSNARDYHRRHKVCEMHSKASEALVGNVLQRFCQQCSRFHILQEFDEGKRSCRRRLAGHNKRRRKAHPDVPACSGPVPDEKSSSYLLISLLRILSNIHLSSVDQMKGQDLLSHLLRNLADTVNGQNSSSLLLETMNVGASGGNQDKTSGATQKESTDQPVMQVASNAIQELVNVDRVERINLKNIDLNSACEDDMKGLIGSSERCDARESSKANHYVALTDAQYDLQESSPPQPSALSNSNSSQSPSSSNGEDQSQTDRIVFKLFGKDPNDLPGVLRSQILHWLSHSPTEMESYIRPGCIILTIYLRLKKPMWKELCHDLGSSLRKLLDVSSDPFWRSGWIYMRVQDFASFICDGKVILETPLPLKHSSCRITSIRPIAVAVSKSAQFSVKGFNLIMPNSKLFCALEGKYLAQKDLSEPEEEVDMLGERDVLQSFNFQCSVPETCGRGFIEVEDYGLTSSFFPFIVAEEDVCSEICMLESSIEVTEASADIVGGARNAAIEFLHEFGWLLHRSHLKARLGSQNHTLPPFPFKRFKWLLEFSMEHDWCAVVKKLLGILYDGVVDADGHSSVNAALLALDLLHVAVQRNCRPMVEFLLRYIPKECVHDAGSDVKEQLCKSRNSFIFKPNAVSAGGLTPLHIAAATVGSEDVLDALTNDPLSVGTEAWKTARDSLGLTPNDYASLRGHYSYIHLVLRKINRKSHGDPAHVILDVPSHFKQKLSEGLGPTKSFGSESGNIRLKPLQMECKLCKQRLAHRITRTSQIARPAMLSMVAVAAICVCAALLFKSSPNVVDCFRPFVWEKLPYGSS